MKCPNCGAIVQGKICDYCRSEMPQEKANINITNHYYGGMHQQNTNTSVGKCSNYGSTKKGVPTWVWVLGWICIFPVPLTILLLRKNDMVPKTKYGIIAVAWLVYLVIGIFGDTTNPDHSNETSSQIENVQVDQLTQTSQQEIIETTESTEEEKVIDVDSYINNIVDKYNSQVTEQLVYVEDFTPSDESSGHYRIEFRLGAYKSAVGKSYLLGDKVVDFIVWKTIFNGVTFRVYADNASLKQVIALIKGMSPLMDETLSDADLESAVNEIETEKTANGYYYGQLCITLLGNDDKGYDLMIKKK